jgi:hypothetical protein
VLYANHIEQNGKDFFRLICDRDFEGMAAKYKCRYGEGWWKIRNAGYSQYEGRHELFERKRTASTG